MSSVTCSQYRCALRKQCSLTLLHDPSREPNGDVSRVFEHLHERELPEFDQPLVAGVEGFDVLPVGGQHSEHTEGNVSLLPPRCGIARRHIQAMERRPPELATHRSLPE